MALSEHRRDQLSASLNALRIQRPIDNPQIERALVAILEALLDERGQRTFEPDALGLTGSDLGR